MTSFIAGLILLVEIVISLVVAFWMIVALAWSGEGHRSEDLSSLGWALGWVNALVALIPVGMTIWLIYRRFFSDLGVPGLPSIRSDFSISGYWMPLFGWIGSICLCYGLSIIYNASAYTPRPTPPVDTSVEKVIDETN